MAVTRPYGRYLEGVVTLERSTPPPRRAAGTEGLLCAVIERLEARPAGLDSDDRDLVMSAGRLADEVHRGQVRHSGEPYVTHPIAVASIVAHLGLDPRRSPQPCSTTPSRTPACPSRR